MNKVLVVVDMQNDFIDGSLANPMAQVIVNDVAKYVASFDGLIVFTRDTHEENYLETREGKNLPVPHCIALTDGWQINKEIYAAAENNPKAKILRVNKPTFSAGTQLYAAIKTECESPDEIQICGTCTDICVVSNALSLVGSFQEANIVVLADLCAGLTKEKHYAALEVMRSCQISAIYTHAGLKDFVTQCLPSDFFDENGTLSKHVASDIGYDIKSDIEASRFNPLSAYGNYDYEVAFDEWYDLFVWDEIIPILVELGAIDEE